MEDGFTRYFLFEGHDMKIKKKKKQKKPMAGQHHSHKYKAPELRAKRLNKGMIMSTQGCAVEGCKHIRHNVGPRDVKTALAQYRRTKGTRYDV